VRSRRLRPKPARRHPRLPPTPADYVYVDLEGQAQPLVARAAAVEAISSWIDWPGNSPGNEPTADTWSRHWVRCIDEARECDVLLFVSGEDEQACRVLIEAGTALAVGRQLFVVWPDASTFSHRPRNFSTLADAIAAIVTMQTGEAARGYSASTSGTNSP
jgi:hypothetical protein